MSLAVGLAAPYGLAFTYFRMGFNTAAPVTPSFNS